MSCISTCNKPYSPDKEIQRFCSNCNQWYHIRCLDVLSPLGSIKSHLPPTEVQAHHKVDKLFKALICCPVERGITAGVFGNGWGIHQARQWYNQLVNEGYHLPDDWITQMDQIDTRWIAPTKNLANTTYYQCPNCPKYWL